jgi:threonine dehydratase
MLLLQVSDPDALDAVFVAIGGGGLIAGVAAYLKALKPHIKIYGVEPTGANAMAMSLAKGQRVTLRKVDAFADGVAVKQVCCGMVCILWVNECMGPCIQWDKKPFC